MSPEETKPNESEALQCAVQAVARSKRLLTSACVESLSHCEDELESAVQYLERATRDLDATSQSERSSLGITAQRLQREIADFVRLLRQAQDFQQGWIGLTESSLVGYTASGDPAPVGRDYSRIAVKG
jgi:hypothetical protein